MNQEIEQALAELDDLDLLDEAFPEKHDAITARLDELMLPLHIDEFKEVVERIRENAEACRIKAELAEQRVQLHDDD